MLRSKALKRSTYLLKRQSNVGYQSRGIQTKEKLFDKILIANRGEIAVRVMKTCRKLGIKTVAVYSEPDATSMAVRMADEAVCVGPAASNKSYLSIPNIIDAIKQTGAQAVHPGYGFLSENQAFSKALEEIGVAFIGPGPKAIQAMGDKIESKIIAKEAGVNTIPGWAGLITDAEHAVKVANEVGYPVMIKASAGGGGKGMRVAYDDEEVRMGFRMSREEAASSFGDDRMFIEKFIEDPRHIEIQLIADTHGNVVTLPERECSIQRRNQKVIEEAPSVLLDEETRRAMQKQAAMLAKKVGYVSAGTVEMLCDKHKNFYFLEMNTRLQVEHAITEKITGVDLVEQMIRVAAGYALPKSMTEKPVPIKGWSMEARVYAEDPLRGFLPSIGRLLQYSEPTKLPGVRVDSGVEEGSDISMFYDPMIAKLVTHGKDRTECLHRMQDALKNYVIRGPGHNLALLHDVFRHPRFIDGRITTKFIAEEYPEGFTGVKLSPSEIVQVQLVGVLMYLRSEWARRQHSGRTETFEQVHAADLIDEESCDVLERLPTMRNEAVVPRFRAKSRPITSCKDAIEVAKSEQLQLRGDKYFVSVEGSFGESEPVVAVELEGVISSQSGRQIEQLYTLLYINNEWYAVDSIDWQLNGLVFNASIHEENAKSTNVASQFMDVLPEGFRVNHCGAEHEVIIRTEKALEYSKHMLEKPEIDTSGLLLCPMPGVLISVAVQPGDHVEIGQEMAVVEAMKMQNVLRSEKKGTVKSVAKKAGDSLKVDEIILEYE